VSFLDDVLATTQARVAEYRAAIATDALEQRIAAAEPPRGFAAALTDPGVSVIAEIKRATPRGPLKLDLNPRELAANYVAGGADAISVLTEPDFFKGSMEDLAAARGAGLPVLRKDFIIDDFQVLEARAWGADAVLLIVRALSEELERLFKSVTALGMDPFVEVHDEEDVERAREIGATLIGVNNRDLATFEVDPDRTSKLAPLIPDGAIVAALSGVSSRTDVERLADAGADAVLIGETLVTAPDPAARLAELRGP